MAVLEILASIGSFIIIIGCCVLIWHYIYKRLIKGLPSASLEVNKEINEKLSKICEYIDKLEVDSNANCDIDISDN